MYIYIYISIYIYIHNGKENGNYYNGLYRDYRVYWGYIGIMENKMETTIIYWGHRRGRGNQ